MPKESEANVQISRIKKQTGNIRRCNRIFKDRVAHGKHLKARFAKFVAQMVE